MSMDIAAIRARHEKTTPGTEGPGGNAGWYTGESDYLEIAWPIYRDGPNSVESLGGMYILADAEFVAAAHQDIPALCDELEAARNEIYEWEESDKAGPVFTDIIDEQKKELEAARALGIGMGKALEAYGDETHEIEMALFGREDASLADAEYHAKVMARIAELKFAEGLVRELAEMLSDSICHICDNRLGYEPGHTCCAEQRRLLARVPERLRK